MKAKVRPLQSMRKRLTEKATTAEKQFTKFLSEKQENVGFQVIFGYYIVDFLFYSKGVVVELDGNSHNGREEHDSRRDRWIQKFGVKVLRFPNEIAISHPEQILRQVNSHKRPVNNDCYDLLRKAKRERVYQQAPKIGTRVVNLSFSVVSRLLLKFGIECSPGITDLEVQDVLEKLLIDLGRRYKKVLDPSQIPLQQHKIL